MQKLNENKLLRLENKKVRYYRYSDYVEYNFMKRFLFYQNFYKLILLNYLFETKSFVKFSFLFMYFIYYFLENRKVSVNSY